MGIFIYLYAAPAMGFEQESVLKHDFPFQHLILAKLFLKTSN